MLFSNVCCWCFDTVDILLGHLLVLFFYGIVGGRAFCSWVCPINIVTDEQIISRRKFGFNQIQKKQPAQEI
jgi:ferredoxin-type protein NapH